MKAMRHIHLYIYLPFFALLATLSACVGEELSAPKGEGRLRLEIASVTAEVSSAMQTKADETATAKTELENLPDAKDFSVKVIGATGEVLFDKPVTEIPQAGIPLETGKYTVEVHYGNNQELITTILPRYFAGSTTVSIIPGETATASISAKWGYSAVYPVIAEDLAAHYKSYHLDVEVGQTQKQILLNADNTFPTVYLLAGTNASVHLAGTNYTNQEVSNPLFTQTNLPAAMEYTLNVTPDIPVFSFGLRATATHTKDASGYLDGTKVTLSLGDLSGVPTKLISTWTAELVNASNEVVRAYTSTNFTVPDVMVDANAWPYLPQGNYTLKYKYMLNGEEVSEEQTETATVVVPAPEFEVAFAPYTSYTKYTEGKIAEANSCENNKIYNVKASVNISNDLLTNAKYNGSFTYSYEGTAENIASNSFDKGDLSVSEWKQYAVSASATFDGVTKEIALGVHITGLPYVPDTMIGADWTLASRNCKYENGMIQLGGITGIGECTATSKNFHIPNNVNVTLDTNVTVRDGYVFFGWRETTFTASINGSTVISQPGNREDNDNAGKNYSLSGNGTFSTDGRVVTLNSSYSAAGPWAKVYTLQILYK
ncbi:DUF4493 domain-containing protein [Parabacteroides distasonis]|uniref:DUF4493 domain-containing protein n=1 Tax=Parabacteroides distasonis TaxID=823 RepID=A0A3L7ZMR8_PARDI|nr:DUF4493 domain-containing protein [Parabacteroides distasonis]NBH89522.1 DUF4493 domain-containing protein [Parabacteroides distasonis]RLT72247.1 DUF4493 domain-containing protein [Parabacteroides distasonis]